MDPALVRLVVVLVGVALTTLVGRRVVAARDRVRPVVASGPAPAPASPGAAAPAERTAEDTGTHDDAIADGPTAVLFGSPTCTPCETLKVLLREVEASRDDFRWTYVDAAEHLDLARAHEVRRVPTLLVLDPTGTVVARSGGVPSRQELGEAVRRAAGEEPVAAPDVDRAVATDSGPATTGGRVGLRSRTA